MCATVEVVDEPSKSCHPGSATSRPGRGEGSISLHTAIGHWLLEAKKEGHVSETPSFEEVLHALKVRLAASPQLRYQPAEDIGHDLMTNGYLSTEPDPALVRRALAEIGDNGGAS